MKADSKVIVAIPPPEVKENFTYKGHAYVLCLEYDGNASVREAIGNKLIVKHDVLGQTYHLSKWQIRQNENRNKHRSN